MTMWVPMRRRPFPSLVRVLMMCVVHMGVFVIKRGVVVLQLTLVPGVPQSDGSNGRG